MKRYVKIPKDSFARFYRGFSFGSQIAAQKAKIFEDFLKAREAKEDKLKQFQLLLENLKLKQAAQRLEEQKAAAEAAYKQTAIEEQLKRTEAQKAYYDWLKQRQLMHWETEEEKSKTKPKLSDPIKLIGKLYQLGDELSEYPSFTSTISSVTDPGTLALYKQAINLMLARKPVKKDIARYDVIDLDPNDPLDEELIKLFGQKRIYVKDIDAMNNYIETMFELFRTRNIYEKEQSKSKTNPPANSGGE